MAYINRNIDNASQLKFWPGIIFSSPLEQYVKGLADVHGLHPDSLAIILINCVAATLEFSYVLCANRSDNMISTNLFNLIVARSSYGKSELTKILRNMLKVVVTHRLNKFRKADQIVTGQNVNATLDETSKAGLLAALDDCCRTIVCDEADLTFADIGLFYLINTGRAQPDMNCRTLVLTFFDQTTEAYVRQLQGKTISVNRSKFNILGCSTGELVSNMVMRMKAGLGCDPMIGRFLFWPLDGPVIPDKITQQRVDYTKMSSLNQFAIILSFVENVIFKFEEDALEEIVLWGNDCKQKSFDVRNNDAGLAARLGKTVQHAYRLAALINTIEIAFTIHQEYLEVNNGFPNNGLVDTNFVNSIEYLFHSKFPHQFQTSERKPFLINKTITSQAIDLISCNMRQFRLLFDATNVPKLSSLGRQVVIVTSDQNGNGTNGQALIEPSKIKQEEQQQKYLFNFNAVAGAIILFPSICFTKKQLHKSSFIHNNSSGGLLKEVLEHLVTADVLIVCQRGIKNQSGSTPVYIKRLCNQDDSDEEENLASMLSEYTFENKPVTIEAFRNACENTALEAIGIVQSEVFAILRRREYGNRDVTSLTLLPRTAPVRIEGSASSVIGDDTDSIALDFNIDEQLQLDSPQEQENPRSSQLTEESTQSNIEASEESSMLSFAVPVNSGSTAENVTSNDAIRNDEFESTAILQDENQESVPEARLIELLCKDSDNEDARGSISDEHENALVNDGFTSPTAWKTRARQKSHDNGGVFVFDCNSVTTDNSSTAAILTGNLMALTSLSIGQVAYGNIDGLPIKLQILDMHHLNGDVLGVSIVRLKLSDGEKFYGGTIVFFAHSKRYILPSAGFVVNVSLLETLSASVYDIVRIDKIIVLNRSPGKTVLQIVRMEVVSHESAIFGEPQLCQFDAVPKSSATSNNMICVPESKLERRRSEIDFQEEPTSILLLTSAFHRGTMIEGRVIRKSEILTYSNGTGKFFTFDIADFSGEIRCKAFNDVADQFFEHIVLGNAYRLHDFFVSRANKQFNHLSHDFEINLLKNTIFDSIHNDIYSDVDISYHITKISDVSSNDIGKCFDLRVTIKSVGNIESIFIMKKKCYSTKRAVQVQDDSDNAVIIFWGDMAMNFTGRINQTMKIKDLVVQCFKGDLQFATTMTTVVRLEQHEENI
ncbi:unnamed protein product [Adineta ricciae]|uniref:OB domain-containing protein n=2 Tax=Adineta ricciae TaxID=249248 RepID=A0A815SD56_ADIRI|nr:unnamed protein product [Adineta ricciae]